MIEYSDALTFVVAGANIAGYLEVANKISIPDDQDLTHKLVDWINEFDYINEFLENRVSFDVYITHRLMGEYRAKEGRNLHAETT